MGVKSVSATTRVYDDGVAVVYVKGEIVTNLRATEVVKIVESLMKEHVPPKIVISLGRLNYIDSFSFNWILNVYKEIAAKKGQLAICDPNEDIIELFEVTNFGKGVPIFQTEAEAREALNTGDDSKRIAF